MIGSSTSQGDGVGDGVAVAVLTSDLMTHSQISASAQRVSVAVRVVASSEALLALCQVVDRAGPRAVILDLSHPKLDLGGMVANLRQAVSGLKIVAFGPHVHEDLLAEAGRAGCDAVMARGAFLSQLDSLLPAFAAGPFHS
jgi:DNA-binding NarL/FixJ family response regulator